MVKAAKAPLYFDSVRPCTNCKSEQAYKDHSSPNRVHNPNLLLPISGVERPTSPILLLAIQNPPKLAKQPTTSGSESTLARAFLSPSS
ncbi:hypothetical protein L218DRAFT_958811 [Marasmius fiardii PR-910]|nr:hypothetical protein L218DRAFT_958811 [Marasmius fiardii PR-910]